MLPQPRDNRIRVLLADDSAVILRPIRMLLADDSGIQIVGEVASKTDLFRVLRETNPDVLVMDLHMCAGSDAMSALRQTQGLGILVMSALIGKEAMELAARLGVNEVLEKSDLQNTLVNAVKNAYLQRYPRRKRFAVAS